MKSEVRKMLDSMYDTLTAKFHDPVKAWDHLIEFLAVDNCGSLFYQVDHKFEWLFEDRGLADKLMNTYDPKILRSDYYDHLGEMYLDRVISTDQAQRQGQFLTPMAVAEMTAAMTIGETDKPVRVLDPCVGTGRMLMAAHRQAPNAKLFGVDLDQRMVRIALTNFAIHDISGYLLHADSLHHETDLSTEEGRYNWQFANRWNSNLDQLKSINYKNRGDKPSGMDARKQVTLF